MLTWKAPCDVDVDIADVVDIVVDHSHGSFDDTGGFVGHAHRTR